MDEGYQLDDPLAAARTAIAADDMAYWVAHPEVQGLVAHFMAKGEKTHKRVTMHVIIHDV